MLEEARLPSSGSQRPDTSLDGVRAALARVEWMAVVNVGGPVAYAAGSSMNMVLAPATSMWTVLFKEIPYDDQEEGVAGFLEADDYDARSGDEDGYAGGDGSHLTHDEACDDVPSEDISLEPLPPVFGMQPVQKAPESPAVGHVGGSRRGTQCSPSPSGKRKKKRKKTTPLHMRGAEIATRATRDPASVLGTWWYRAQ